jgi:hypothetical protein
LKTLTLLRKYLINTLENSSRYNWKVKPCWNVKRDGVYLEAKQRHDLPSFTKLHSSKQGFDYGSLGACQRDGMGVEKKRSEGYL